MIVVDVNTQFGTYAGQDTNVSLATLVRDLDSHRVTLALAYSVQGVYDDHEAGNAEAIEASRAHRSLLPAAVLELRRYLGWEAEIDRCLAAGVRLFRLFPESPTW